MQFLTSQRRKENIRLYEIRVKDGSENPTASHERGIAANSLTLVVTPNSSRRASKANFHY
jgi:hypothetical protein